LVEVNIVQLIVDSCLIGGLYALMAVGLTFIYRIMSFPNFAHAEFITFGAYAAYFANVSLGLGLIFSSVIAFFATGVIVALSYYAIFARLSAMGSKTMFPMMIGSIGLGLVIRHIIQELMGPRVLYYNMEAPDVYEFLGARATAIDLLIIFISIILVVALHLLLSRTTIGKAMRAISDNVNLAQVSGINTHYVIIAVWFLSGGVAGFAGMLRGLDTYLMPLLGWNLLLPAFAVVILGGIGSFYGAILAGYMLGFAENIGVIALFSLNISNSYRPAIAFSILIIVLLMRPQGLFSNFKTRGDA